MTTIQQLGDRLDACERNAFECVSHDQFDYEDGDGTLRHDAAACPICTMAEARGDYFSAIREPVVAARETLQAAKLTGDLWPEVERLFDAMRAAQARYRTLLDLGPELSTARERCDAAAREEKAESDFDIMSDKFDRQERAREDLLSAQARERRDRRLNICELDGMRFEIVRAPASKGKRK